MSGGSSHPRLKTNTRGGYVTITNSRLSHPVNLFRHPSYHLKNHPSNQKNLGSLDTSRT